MPNTCRASGRSARSTSSPASTYGSDRWQVSTRAVYSSSPNDYKYTNHDKKINIYDEDKNIIGQYHPKERNRSGAFKDLHLLQEVYYNTRKGDKLGLNAWYINSNRELPMLTTDYGDATDFGATPAGTDFPQCPFVGSYQSNWNSAMKGGYIHTWMPTTTSVRSHLITGRR